MEAFDLEIRVHIGVSLSAGDLFSLSAFAPGFTVFQSHGYWQGKAETGVVVSILTTEVAKCRLMEDLEVWSTRFDEECVLISATPCFARLVPCRPVRPRQLVSA